MGGAVHPPRVCDAVQVVGLAEYCGWQQAWVGRKDAGTRVEDEQVPQLQRGHRVDQGEELGHLGGWWVGCLDGWLVGWLVVSWLVGW